MPRLGSLPQPSPEAKREAPFHIRRIVLKAVARGDHKKAARVLLEEFQFKVRGPAIILQAAKFFHAKNTTLSAIRYSTRQNSESKAASPTRTISFVLIL